MGIQKGDNANELCPAGTDLPVIRSKDELEKIEGYLGVSGNF